jgi:hypothetical protein
MGMLTCRKYYQKDCTAALKIYGALIQPHFDYCSSVWDGLNITLNDKLQISKLSWDNLLTRRKKHKAILMLKQLTN